MIYLGLDYGERRIGVACSDELGRFAEAIGCVVYRKEAEIWKQLKLFVDETRAEMIVVGLPKRTTGEEKVEVVRVMKFVEGLKKITPREIQVWDERFTSKEAERILREGNLSIQKRKEKKDALAAAIMLQSYLDHRRLTNSHVSTN
ncbi:MAG: Holliday junction resolvase RuvX [Candidatus Omnitrophica bacterium]|nr:Holliday junction resolvase RuvX [Candidatus Omnitrophota bacterium]